MLKGFLVISFASFILIHIGCSSSKKILHQAGDPIEIFSSEEAVNFNVNDNRKTSSFIITSDVWDSDYNLGQSLNSYIEDYFNYSMDYDSTVNTSRNIKVDIDQFKFEKSNVIKYSFRFTEKYSTDTSGVIRVAATYFDSTYRKKTDELIDLTLTDCLDKYFNSENSTSRIIATNTKAETILEEKDIVHQKETEPIAETQTTKIENKKSEIVVTKNIPQKITLSSFGVSFIKGEKILAGVHFYYSKSRCLPEDQFILKYGAGLNYLNIDNRDDGYKGFQFGGWFPIIIQHYFTNNSEGAFIGASFLLMLGTERISYGYTETSTFYIGPAIEPFLGVKIGNKFSIDAGPFFIALAGSKMLPNDFGFRINTNIWF